MNDLINPIGPEANNERSAEFEDQVVAFAGELGWRARCRNVDLYARRGDQSRGVDVLLACDDPQTGERQGLIGEAKIRHPLTGGVREDVARLSAKVAALGGTIPQLRHCNDLLATRTGMLVYDAKPFDPNKLAEALAAIEPEGLTRAALPREVVVLAPNTLVGLADAFQLHPPHEFFWPPFDMTAGEWSPCAPPHQVGVGLLAWRDPAHSVSLWVRDPIVHDDDADELSTIVWDWRIDVDRIICSSLSRDKWRTLADRWRVTAGHSINRSTGHLPDRLDARGLSFDSMTAFADRWGDAR